MHTNDSSFVTQLRLTLNRSTYLQGGTSMRLVADQQFQYAPNLTLRGFDQLLVEWESRSREDE